MRISILAVACLVLAGCGTVAMKEDVDTARTEMDQRLAKLETSSAKKFSELDKKIAGLEKNQSDQQAALLGLSEDLKGKMQELKVAIDDVSSGQREALEGFKKSQEEKNFEFRRDVDTLKKSQNDLITSSSALNSSLVNLQNDLLGIKTAVQQLAQALDSLNAKEGSRGKDVEAIKKEMEDKMQSQIAELLTELVRHESEIVSLKKATGETKVTAKETGLKTYTVKTGDTLLKISKKYGVAKKKIMEANNMKSETIRTGQKLIIP
jgi:LysM repeat protein